MEINLHQIVDRVTQVQTGMHLIFALLPVWGLWRMFISSCLLSHLPQSLPGVFGSGHLRSIADAHVS
ncbi:hypothetical protein JTB14_002741 [Gonioctena quinquepunctata]|nr:hypothetical protein JTB14_002741 [Gonioctena quinquepunctata]